MKAGNRLDFCIVVPGMAFHGNSDKEQSLGGSESAGLYMARALAKKGHCVSVFCNCSKPGVYDGVDYLPMNLWDEATSNNPHDVLIVQRMPQGFSRKRASRVNLCWLHDMAQHRAAGQFAGVAWNVDRYIVLSDYHKQQVQDATGLPDGAFFKSRNGIDLSLFDDSLFEDNPRNMKQMIYAARPERGLDVMLDHILPRILKKDPEASLVIAGYENYADHMRPFYERIDARMKEFGDRVKHLGYLNKREFYRALAGSACYVYPTPSLEPGFERFNEISCIAAMETQAAGTPMIASSRGALPETLDEYSNVIVEGDPQEGDAFFDRFADHAVNLLGDEGLRNSSGNAARAHALQSFDWDEVAGDWLDLVTDIFAENNDNPVRRFVHSVEQNDVLVAERELALHTDRIRSSNIARKSLDIYDQHYSKLLNPELYAKRYHELGENISLDEVKRSIDDTPKSQRFAYLMNQKIIEGAKVLDYGSWAGHYALNLANLRPDVSVVGIDASKAAVKIGNNFAQQLNLSERCNFVHGRAPISIEDTAELNTSQDFDFAMLFEVLEHIPEPWVTLDAVEAQCKFGATVAITVPFGPWELMQHEHVHKYQHLWNFDLHDMREMLQNKDQLNVTMRYAGTCPKTDEPVGWYLATYVHRKERPAVAIDVERKAKMMRPRQTISANMIVGGELGSNIAAWGIQPVIDIVDEVVIADCGMNEVARTACEHFGVRVVEGVDPNREGFDAARNIALKAAEGDFCLWFDGDEHIVDATALPKYLRNNCFDAYQVVQNHLTIENDHDHDLPARILRTRLNPDGRTYRFFGVVHEHPEFELGKGPGYTICLHDLQLAHVGYLTSAERNKRFDRNLPLHLIDREQNSDRSLSRLFIIRDNNIRAKRLIQQFGHVTKEARDLLEESVQIGREDFLGNAEQFGRSKWLQYYSEALKILGRGATVAFGMAGDNNGDGNVSVDKLQIGHFETIEDAERELCSRLRSECAKYFREDW